MRYHNTNCLQGLRCPKCHSLAPMRIEVLGVPATPTTLAMTQSQVMNALNDGKLVATRFMATYDDDGTEDVTSDSEFNDNSKIICLHCDHVATVEEFKVASAASVLNETAWRNIAEFTRRLQNYEHQTELPAIVSAINTLPHLALSTIPELVALSTMLRDRASPDDNRITKLLDAIAHYGHRYVIDQRDHAWDVHALSLNGLKDWAATTESEQLAKLNVILLTQKERDQ
ncbi:hypothetical protein [Aliagarivorans taiwanensis]|uniref:hypothetical protein n=1 Tax=Aliagarivorans taiwanensis TaxID=561966 RepID=UPI0004253870|nr:hypothetical protein [Aliagarivorans taiwanensis]